MRALSDDQAPRDTSTADVLKATNWTAASFVVQAGSQFVLLAVLARLLSPAEVGQIAVVTLLNALMVVFLGMGLGQAIVQRRNVTGRELSSLFWMNLAIGLAATLAVYVGADAIARLVGVPDAAELLSIASLAFVVMAAGQVPQAILQKRLQFRALAGAEILVAIAIFAVTVSIAATARVPEAMPIGLVAGAVLRTVLFHVRTGSAFKIAWHFSLCETRRFVAFGGYNTVDSLVNYASSNVTALSTGRILGGAELGAFNLAYNTAVNTPARFNPVVTRVMFPVLAEIQDDLPRVRRAFTKAVAGVSLVNIPALLILAATSESFVAAIFGAGWGHITPMLSVLCAVGILRAVSNPVGPLIMGLGRVRLGLFVNLGKTTFTLPLPILGVVMHGALGGAIALCVVNVLSVLIGNGVVKHLTGLGHWTQIRAAMTGVWIGAPGALAAFAVHLVDVTDLPWLSLAVEATVGLVVVTTAFLLSKNAVVLELRTSLHFPRPRRSP